MESRPEVSRPRPRPKPTIAGLEAPRGQGHGLEDSISVHRYLRFLFPQPGTSIHCQTTDTGLVHRAVCLLMHQFSLVLTAPTHSGMTRRSFHETIRNSNIKIIACSGDFLFPSIFFKSVSTLRRYN